MHLQNVCHNQSASSTVIQVTEDLQLATKGRSVLTSHGLADLVQAQSLSRSTASEWNSPDRGAA